jgi:hypothetical protein
MKTERHIARGEEGAVRVMAQRKRWLNSFS